MNISERVFLGFLLAAISAFAGPAWAQSRRPTVPVDEMARQADVIGVATVQSTGSREEPRSGMIWTDYRLQFSEVWKGDPGREFILMKAGGQLPSGDKLTVPDHEYSLKPGESIVVFAIPSKFGNHVPIDFQQGLYRLGGGSQPSVYRLTEHPRAIGNKPTDSLRALKEGVWRALGRPVEPSSAPSSPSNTLAPPANPAESRPIAAPGQPTAQTPIPAPPTANRWWGSLLVFGLILIVGIVYLLTRKKHGLSH